MIATRRSALRTIVLALGALSLAAGPLFAHGTGARNIGSGASVTEFYYSDGTPMAYAEATVLAPDDDSAPFMHGRADRLGRVAFFPSADGVWRVEARDGEGHVARSEIVIAAGAAPPAGRVNRWLFFVSLAGNLFGVMAAWRWWSTRAASINVRVM